MFEGQSISAIKQKILQMNEEEKNLELEQILLMDDRLGVQKIGISLRKNRLKAEEEKQRILQMKAKEQDWNSKGILLVGGVDEAGRGPLAGPVVAACVIMKSDSLILGMNDSKKIKETVREELYEKVIQDSISFGIGIASSEEIDRYNILQATFLAMKRAMQEMKQVPDLVLVDGNQEISNCSIRQETVIHGDSICYSIACASILAKMYRDRIMRDYDRIYPEFDFLSNKGYGTSHHYDALRTYGVTPIHRKSFLKS